MKDQVRRMAENDEPKCKNCKQWKVLENGSYGGCVGNCMRDGEKIIAGHWMTTTDLSLCSAWEPKE